MYFHVTGCLENSTIFFFLFPFFFPYTASGVSCNCVTYNWPTYSHLFFTLRNSLSLSPSTTRDFSCLSRVNHYLPLFLLTTMHYWSLHKLFPLLLSLPSTELDKIVSPVQSASATNELTKCQLTKSLLFNGHISWPPFICMSHQTTSYISLAVSISLFLSLFDALSHLDTKFTRQPLSYFILCTRRNCSVPLMHMWLVSSLSFSLVTLETCNISLPLSLFTKLRAK